MEQSLGSLTGAVGLLAGAAIWAILFVVILGALKRASLFSGPATYVVAACASLLSVIGMSRIFSGGPGRSAGAGKENLLEFLLLPYAAMGIAMLLVLLLLLLRKRRPDRERPRHPSEPIFGDARGRHKKPPPADAISRGA
jgi:tellurite resistance protein TehA-like permease